MVRVGIVGTGTMGTRYTQVLKRAEVRDRAGLVAVCDAVRERADAVGQSTGVPAFTDITTMIRTAKPDVVYIAVPDHLHRDPVLAAAKLGVHILVEKPLALTVADAVAMRDAVAAAGVKAEVNFSNRWNPPFVSAKRSIDAGEIGKPLTVNSRLNNVISSPTKRLAWSGQTTSAWYLLSHVLDLWRWLSGKRAVSVYANGVKDKLVSLGVTTYDYIHAMVKYQDGTDGMYEAAWMLPDSLPSPTDFKFHVIGREGAIFINTQDQMVHTAAADRYNYSATLEWAVQRFHGFLDVVQHGTPPVATFADGVENTRILVAMHEALTSGTVVSIPGEA